ncbi:hypothetical protein [Paenibacillus vini]|uniref:RelA/SpoT domain-containing protein n=1 Tax=Paenibacillus vini TaxID=1476024 RepID=A0ABQ4MH00_9BACL|nr:hypothetical protein [Paenibacillus vini]GIP55265.1 hypothetical protein J42TS3_43000 [Paenibacillus vini]
MGEGQFKRAIGRYQTEGDREVINDILRHFRQGSATDADDPTTFVADKIAKTSRSEVHGFEHSALKEFRDAIEKGIGIDIFAEPDLRTAIDHAAEILAFLGNEAFAELEYAINEYQYYLPLLHFVIVPALEHALRNVDPSRTERAIVNYVNRAFQTQYMHLSAELDGLRRLGRRGESGNFYNVFVKPRPAHAWSIVFDRRVQDAEVPALLERLTQIQRGYAERAFEIVSQDIDCGEMDEYRVDEGGNYRIKFRYMAECLDVEESNLRKTFGKIRDRAAENVPNSAYKVICKGA